MLTCASCGRQNPEGARFCNACAAPLAVNAPAEREERKVVTVLFADLVGFTARAERMDPEEVRRLLQPYHARLRSVLEHHGGTVEKFIGDAVMALFGAPVAHEDDPERALRAALAIRDALAEDGELEVRVGITTGEALVALGARPEAGEGVASGDVVNTAARLQAAAPVGGILVDETTYRATERAVEYREAAPILAKGKADPVRVWEALRARSRVGLERPSEAPLVGRTQELTLLLDTLARVKREREPQLITLVGVPGIGKSRLVFELSQELEQSSEPIHWRHGRSPPYGEGVTFWALGEMVKAQAGVLESDRTEQTEDKLREAVAAAISDRAEAAWVERHLLPLAGIETEDFGSGDRRSEAFAAWRRFLEALAEERPLVLVFEDLHWADDALLDFVDHLADWASGVPIFLLATTRPELLARREGWGGGRVNSATILLTPLSDEETAALVTALLGRSGLAAEAEADLLERAGGNPLYAEEFARMVTDRPEELALPESVHGLIAARLDALPQEEKDLLQDAAVMGKVFWLGALGNERWRLEERLHSLARKEFVRRERRSSVAGEAEYSFRHALIREVAYEQIPKSQRAAKHRSTAEWIESLGRREDHAEMLAHHYVQALGYAGEAGEGTDQLAGRAVGALQDAGDRALSLNAYPAAARLYETALEALGPSDEEMRCELLLSLGEAEGRAGNTAAANEVLLDAADLARRLGLSRELARAANNYGGRMVWARGSLDARLVPLLEEGLAGLGQENVELRARLLARLAGALRDEHTRDRRDGLSREAVELARRTGNPAALAGALDGRAFAILAPDTLAECIALGSELRDVAERIGDRERVVDGHMERVAALAMTGEVNEAEADVAAALPLAEQLGQPAYVWDAGGAQAMLALAKGRLSEGAELAERFFALGQPAVGASAVAVYQVQRYTLCDFRGRVGEVEPAIRDLIATQPTRTIFRCVLAHLHARLGRLPEAEQALRELAEDDFSIVSFDQEWLFCMSLLAETSALVGDAESASVLHRLLLPWAQLNVADLSEGIRGSVSRYLGVLATTLKRWDEAEQHFEDAVAMNARMGLRPWLAETQSDYAQMLLGRDVPGDRERAHELLGAAIATYRDLGMESFAAKAQALTQEVGTTAY